MSKNYESYHNYHAKDVPIENLKTLIMEFIVDAGLDMGQTPDQGIYDRVTYLVVNDFNTLTVMQIGSAIKRGALGQYGPGKLVPRTIYGWLNECRNDALNKSGAADKVSTDRGFRDYSTYPVGRAIMKKIDWLNTGVITPSEWERIPIKVLAEMIANDSAPTPQDFGIKEVI